MKAQEQLTAWLWKVGTLDISANHQDLLDLLLRYSAELNYITQKAEYEHATGRNV
jgi:hypothetical protein